MTIMSALLRWLPAASVAVLTATAATPQAPPTPRAAPQAARLSGRVTETVILDFFARSAGPTRRTGHAERLKLRENTNNTAAKLLVLGAPA